MNDYDCIHWRALLSLGLVGGMTRPSDITSSRGKARPGAKATMQSEKFAIEQF